MIPTHRVFVVGTEFLFDETLPLVLLRTANNKDRVVSWPELDLGIIAPETSLLAAPDGIWVVYGCGSDGDRDEFGIIYEPASLTAVWVGTNAGFEAFHVEGHRALGATSAGLWSGPNTLQWIDDEYLGGELPPEWSSPTQMLLHAPGQRSRSVEVDRYVVAVGEDSRGLVVYVNPSPPVVHPSSDGASYGYRCTGLVLGTVDEVPRHVKFKHFITHGWGSTCESPEILDVAIELDQRRPVARPGSEQITWALASIDPAQQKAAEQLLTRQFSESTYWNPPNQQHLAAHYDVRESRMRVAGQWPHTHVIVEVIHPSFPEGWIRRTFQIFDGAGRINVDRYASIWFMEDLDTGALPLIGVIQNGVLEG